MPTTTLSPVQTVQDATEAALTIAAALDDPRPFIQGDQLTGDGRAFLEGILPALRRQLATVAQVAENVPMNSVHYPALAEAHVELRAGVLAVGSILGGVDTGVSEVDAACVVWVHLHRAHKVVTAG